VKLLLLVHADEGTLLVIDALDILKYANDYSTVHSMCLYRADEVCAAFAAYFEKGVQQRI
jgi:hypothetical protein